MEASQMDIRLKLLEQNDQNHERVHGRMWDKINAQGTDLAVHKVETAGLLKTMQEDVAELKDDAKTNRRLLITTLITVVAAAAGLIANFIVILADQTPK